MYYGLFLISWFTLRLLRKENIERVEIKKKKKAQNLYFNDLLLRKGDKRSWDIFQAVLADKN